MYSLDNLISTYDEDVNVSADTLYPDLYIN